MGRKFAWLALLGGCLTGCVGSCGSEAGQATAAEQALRAQETALASSRSRYERPVAEGQSGYVPGVRPSGVVYGERSGRSGVWLFGEETGTVAWLPLGPVGALEVLATGAGYAPNGCAAVGEGVLCTSATAPGVRTFGLASPPGRQDFRGQITERGGYKNPYVLGGEAVWLDTVEGRWVRWPENLPGDAAKGPEDGGDHEVTLDSVGLQVEHCLGDGARSVLPLPGGRLAVAAGIAPRLTLQHVGGHRRRQVLSQDAPVRALAFDAGRNTLWAVGLNPAPVRRDEGPVRGLFSVLLGFELPGDPVATGTGEPVAKSAVDLRAHGVIDATGIALWEGVLAIVGSGSRNVLLFSPDTGEARALPTGSGPGQPVVTPAGLVIPNRFDETITLISGTPQAPQVQVIPLGPAPAICETPRLLGELLFHEKHLWGESEENRFTCNSCHWELSTDHRMQPGMLESRRELTRPVRGISMVAPLFTPMQSPMLADAVKGFFTVLDERHWQDVPLAEGLALPLREGICEVSADQAQFALLTFLMTANPRVGPLRRADGSFSPEAKAGAALFVRDCAGCHEPTENLRHRKHGTAPLTVATLLEQLHEGPLSFGAPLYARSGVEPYYTTAGNRISPLLDLGRGGPFFSNGSARTLADVIRRTRPGDTAVHDPAHGVAPVYGRQDVAALRAFLLAL